VIETSTYPDGVVRLSPLGDLDWISARALRHAVHDLINPRMRVEFDLHDVMSIDAAGISALLGSVRLIRSLGGEARVCNMSKPVRSRFEMLGIDVRSFAATGAWGDAA
jgi:anti-anti-sigma factor